MLASQPRINNPKFFIWGVIGLFIFLIGWGSFYTVASGQRAIVLRFGQIQEVVSDGLHLKLPIVE